MATIAALDVALNLSSAAFTRGAQVARGAVSELKGSLTSLNGVLAGVGVTLSAGAFVALVKSSADSIDHIGKLSDRLGVTTESLLTMRHAADLAGISTEEMDGALSKMLQNLGGAQSSVDGGKIGDALSQLGLSAKQLANTDTDKALGMIADGMSKIQNPAQRAATAVAIFGKAGQKLLPMLMEGSQGIAKARQDLEKSGGLFSRADALRVEAANDAITRLKLTTQALGQQFAIQLSPFIEAAADKLRDMATSGTGMAEKVTSGLGIVRDAVAFVADEVEALSLAFKFVQLQATKAWAAIANDASKVEIGETVGEKIGLIIQHPIDNLKKGLVNAADMLDAGQGFQIRPDFASSFANNLDEEVKQLQDDFDKSFAGRGWGDKIRTGFDKLIADAKALSAAAASAKKPLAAIGETAEDNTDKIAQLIASLEKQAATFGMSATQIAIYTAEQLHASDADMKRISDLALTIDSMERAKKAHEEMASFAKSTFEATRTPLEKYETQIDKLSEALNAGAINWETYSRAVKAANVELFKSNTVPSPTLAGGSTPVRDTAGFTTAFKSGASAASPLSQIEKNTRAQLDVAKKSKEALDKMNNQLGNEAVAYELIQIS